MTSVLPLDLFAVVAPGLEEIVARELDGLGIRGAVEAGGVGWTGSWDDMFAANLQLRTAARVLLRIGDFRARTFFELERHASGIDWRAYVGGAAAIRLRVSSRKSKLYHQGAIAERFARAIEAATGIIPTTAGAGEAEGGVRDEAVGAEIPAAREQLFLIRFVRDRCLVSADSTGRSLRLRGYREAIGKAPLRETLAAASVLASGWDARHALLDPFCGSGVIPIEAALLARRIPPGLARPDRSPRSYSFQQWTGYDAGAWAGLVERARGEIRPGVDLSIRASDRDAGAVRATLANAERAGVAGDLEAEVRPISAVAPATDRGWLVTNPPYGVRVGERDSLRDLYAAFGRVVRTRFGDWTVAMWSADDRLQSQVGLPLREGLRTSNGGIPVRLMVGPVAPS